MREDFLHYVWRHKKITTVIELTTEQGQRLEIIRFGEYLQTAGPDFFNAQIRLNGQLWAGTIEMHVKSSDWYSHRHEQDKAYENVILHVVWQDDIPVIRADNTIIPTLVLQKYVQTASLENYEKLMSSRNELLCETEIQELPVFVWELWKEKLLLERLEKKAVHIEKYLLNTQNNWEEVLYLLLLRSFGLNRNGDSFEQLGKHIPWQVIRKERNHILHVESLFFGSCGWLKQSHTPYQKELKKTFEYLLHKHQIIQNNYIEPQFFKLRPDNFPTIRLAQLAQLLHQSSELFNRLVVQSLSYTEIVQLLKVNVSDFWKTHYVFEKESPFKNKAISASFVDLLLINTFLPLQFVYRKHRGEYPFEKATDIYQQLPSEKNAITDLFSKHKIKCHSAFDSQALKELKTYYCDQQNCLSCAVGHYVLSNE